MEFECEFDWEKLKNILDDAPVENEYIEYNGVKYIKEEYCVLKSRIKKHIENRQMSIDDIRDNLDIDQAMISEIKRLEIEIDVLELLMNTKKEDN